MATIPESQDPPLDLREQLARIDQMHADIGQKLAGTDRTRQEIRFAPFTIAFACLGAGAALFAAGATFAKLLIN